MANHKAVLLALVLTLYISCNGSSDHAAFRRPGEMVDSSLSALPNIPGILAINTLRCRSRPGDSSFPSEEEWKAFNASINGRLVASVPFPKFCRNLPSKFCTDEQFKSSLFRSDVPGAMNVDAWVQDYESVPPSLCYRNHTVCGQGNVPLYAVAARDPQDMQTAIRFASKHNLRVAVKASGHDYLGRSTAKDSLLIWTRHFQDVTFTENLSIRNKSHGSAVTVGSGVTLSTLYERCLEHDKVVVGGTAATVIAAGGYLGGGGHSALSPTYGLAADNCLEFQIILADGSSITANEFSHPDLFWAVRGGGPGTWGVVISATFRTYPMFRATRHLTIMPLANSSVAEAAATVHARHIFDLDRYRAGQYFFTIPAPDASSGYFAYASTYFPHVSVEEAERAMLPFLDALSAAGVDASVLSVKNDPYPEIVRSLDDEAGVNGILGSRLIKESVYKETPRRVGSAYKELLDKGSHSVLAHLVAGGQVSHKPDLPSSVNPAWRSAKIHLVIVDGWLEQTPVPHIQAIKKRFTQNKVAILSQLAGEGSGAYMNEADVREPDYRRVFFGENYGRLSAVKRRYDPADLFIVSAGVGSERWDTEGMCLRRFDGLLTLTTFLVLLDGMRTISFPVLLTVASVIRIALIAYSEHYDALPSTLVKYTDVDYRVFTDAARFVLTPGSENRAEGPLGKPLELGSPYTRATYRYTPLLALLMIPNIVIHPAFGKTLFAAADLLIGLMVHQLLGKTSQATILSATYLLNPLVIGISTRGSSEAVLGALVVIALSLSVRGRWDAAAVAIAVAAHWKIYPAVYGVAVVSALYREPHGVYKGIRFAFLSSLAFVVLNSLVYLVWGWPFLEHAFLYHAGRRDHRHNFSPYFYLTYLTYSTTDRPIPDLPWTHRVLRSPLLSFPPQFGLTVLSGAAYGLQGRHHLPMAWFVQTFAFVLLNKVCTSQYFLWYMWLIPFVLPRIRMSLRKWGVVAGVWAGTQALWLQTAYRLEFLGESVFGRLWIASMVFLFGNTWVLAQFASTYQL